MTSLVFQAPAPFILARLSNTNPRSNADTEWCTGIKFTSPTPQNPSVESIEANLLKGIEYHHRYVHSMPEKGNRWSIISVQIIWDMPAEREMISTYNLDEEDEDSLLGVLLWRNARDYLIVEYEEAEDEDFLWEDEVVEENQIDIVGEEYVDDCTRMVKRAFSEKSRL